MSMSQAPLTGIAPGKTDSLKATPLDSLGNPTTIPAGLTPIWVSSDPSIAVVTATADGLSATVEISANAPIGSTVNISISLTLADGSVPTSGPVGLPVIDGTVVLPVASFVITQGS